MNALFGWRFVAAVSVTMAQPRQVNPGSLIAAGGGFHTHR
jgi:hypothetical protein